MTACLFAAAVLLAACGSSKKSSSSTPATSSTAPAKTQELELYDFRFNPRGISVKPGQKVTVELKNEGKVEHNFSVDSLHIAQDIEAGKKATVTLTAPQSGLISFYCKYHKASHNMVGAVLVNGVKSTTKPTAPPSTNTSTSGGSSSGY